jgi:hypothetical protein
MLGIQAVRGLRVKRVLDLSIEPQPLVGIVARSNRLDEQFPKWLIPEHQLAENIEDLAAEGPTHFFQLIQQALVDVAFTGLCGDEVPKVANLRLADTVNAPKALLKPIRIPWKVVVDH